MGMTFFTAKAQRRRVNLKMD